MTNTDESRIYLLRAGHSGAFHYCGIVFQMGTYATVWYHINNSFASFTEIYNSETQTWERVS